MICMCMYWVITAVSEKCTILVSDKWIISTAWSAVSQCARCGKPKKTSVPRRWSTYQKDIRRYGSSTCKGGGGDGCTDEVLLHHRPRKEELQLATALVGESEELKIGRRLSPLRETVYGDATVLKTMIRSNPGFFLMRNGTVKAKWHHNSFPESKEILKKVNITI